MVGRLPLCYKVEHVIFNFDMFHSRKFFLLEHLGNRALIKDPADEVSNIILLGADTEDYRLELVLADVEKKLPETALKLRVLGLLVNDCLTNCFIVTINRDSFASPSLTPHLGCQDNHPELFQMDIDGGTLEMKWKLPANIFFGSLIPGTPSCKCCISENATVNSIRNQKLHSIKHIQKC